MRHGARARPAAGGRPVHAAAPLALAAHRHRLSGRVPRRGRRLDVTLDPLLDDQELDSRASVGTVYWEGAVRALAGGREVGRGYLELTGYGGALKTVTSARYVTGLARLQRLPRGRAPADRCGSFAMRDNASRAPGSADDAEAGHGVRAIAGGEAPHLVVDVRLPRHAPERGQVLLADAFDLVFARAEILARRVARFRRRARVAQRLPGGGPSAIALRNAAASGSR